MSFPKYAEYKESGVEWLEEFPSHWAPARLRHVANVNPSKSELSEVDRTTLVSFLPMEAVGDDGSISLEQSRELATVENGYTYFKEDDVTLAKITPCFENGKGAIMRGLLNGIGFGTTELTVVRPDVEQTSSEYLYWIFISSVFRHLGESEMYGAGGQKRVPDDFVRNFKIAFPPLEEQRAIATFLDRETSKIDALVAEQRRLIALLKEKRQAVISHAVTKGLDPNVKMKDSGIEWLGEVPEHWEVMKLGRVALSRCDGPFGSGLKSQHYTDEGIRVVRLNNIRHDYFDSSDEAYIDPVHYQAELRGCHDVVAGDLLIAGLGDVNNAVGRACVAPEGIEPAMVKADCFRYRINTNRAITSFLSAQLTVSAPTDAGFLSTGTTRSRMPLSVTSRRMIAFPSTEEQEEIMNHVRERGTAFSELHAEAERAIALLQERRTALISAAVTGKIDVRGWGGEEGT